MRRTVMLLLFISVCLVGISYAAEAPKASQEVSPVRPKVSQELSPKASQKVRMSGPKRMIALRVRMRTLWEDHIAWTRNYIISTLADLPDADKVAERLLKNQDEIGNVIKPFYGDEAGKKLSSLLRDHILIAAEVVKAAKTGNQKDMDKAREKWLKNADDIAVFLSGANPNLPRKALEDMLRKHLEFTTQEVTARLKKDWAADIDAYDKGQMHILNFSDVLTAGIIKQFPGRFKD